MKFIFITAIIITALNFLTFSQTYSSGDGEWATVMSSTTTDNPEPGETGTYYQVNGTADYVIDDNVYTDDAILGISLDSGGELTIGDDITGGSDTLTINGTLITANNSTVTINEGDVIIVNGDLRDNMSGNLIVNGTLKVTGDVLNQESSEITVGTNGTILVGGDFTNDNSGWGTNSIVENSGTISVGGTYTGTYTGNEPEDELGASEVLPIELISFSAIKSGESVHLNWSTASELNNDYFTIERSSNGISYETIATISGAGNSSSILDYSFIDNNPINGMSYYRLTQTDYNGQFEIFSPVSISIIQDYQEIKVGPNPTSDYININLTEDYPEGTILLYNAIGTLVKSINIDANKITIDVANLHSGAYIVSIQQQNETISKQIIIQN